MPEQRQRRIAKTWASIFWAMKSRSADRLGEDGLSGRQIAWTVLATFALALIGITAAVILIVRD